MHLVIAASLVLVGRWPNLEAALYVTALTAAVIFAGYTLLSFVLSQSQEPDRERTGGGA